MPKGHRVGALTEAEKGTLRDVSLIVDVQERTIIAIHTDHGANAYRPRTAGHDVA